MQLARLATHRPVTTSMLLISVVVLGIVALSRLPLLYLPAYDSPRLYIVVPYPSSAPEETARLIVEPIEEVMGTVSHLQRITSQASASEGRIGLEFKHGTDMDLVAVEVRDRLNRVRRRLPSDGVSSLPRCVMWCRAPGTTMRATLGMAGVCRN